MIKAVIFDLDGTLIDTEKLYRIYWPKAFKAFGYEMSDAQALMMRSLGRPFAAKQLKEWFGKDLDYEKIRGLRRTMMEKYFAEHGIELKRDAIRVLEELRKKGYITAIATANDEERTNRYLKKLGMDQLFVKVICATMVEKGKPAPDIYQFACKELRLNPQECLAVEDSPNGVMSAAKAGCQVTMIPDLTMPGEELADMITKELTGLSELLIWLDELRAEPYKK